MLDTDSDASFWGDDFPDYPKKKNRKTEKAKTACGSHYLSRGVWDPKPYLDFQTISRTDGAQHRLIVDTGFYPQKPLSERHAGGAAALPGRKLYSQHREIVTLIVRMP